MYKTDNYAGKKVLVTGGNGLIGSHTIDVLVELNADVRVTFNNYLPANRIHSVNYIPADLTNPSECKKAVSGMDYVFNCAASSYGAKILRDDPKKVVTPNVLINTNMLDASAEADVQKFMFISSTIVYPNSQKVMKEGDVTGEFYEGYYGAASMKMFGEALSRFYHNNYGMKVAIVRPSNIYGPRDNFDRDHSHVLPALIRRAVEKENPFEVWGDGTNVRDFIYVTDFVDSMLEVMERHCVCDPVNIGSGDSVALKEVIPLILNLSDHNPQVVYDVSKPNAIPFRRIDIIKSHKILNTRSKVTLEEGLRETIKWYKNERGS